MPLTDRPLDVIREQRSRLSAPLDLVEFWTRTLAESRTKAEAPTFERYHEETYRSLSVDDVTFSGFDGQRIKAWLLRPTRQDAPLPCVVRFIGYGGGRGIPAEYAFLPATGIATLVMDTRAQGDSPDSGAGESEAEELGWMTRGIANPATYYYRRVFADAVRAIDTATEHPAIDPSRIAVAGQSQGGGIALAAAALAGYPAVKACWAAVPFLCDLRHAMTIATEGPYLELVDYLAKRPERIRSLERTLAYFDCAILAALIEAPTTLTVGLMDGVCPPSSVFSVYNALRSDKRDIRIFEFSGHGAPPRLPEYEAEFFLSHFEL